MLLSLLAIQAICHFRQGTLQLIHSSEGWRIQDSHSARCHSGVLVKAGYRSAWLIIVAIQSEDSSVHRVAIWRDQLSSRQFSYLHQQLAFAATSPLRQTPTAWLRGLLDCVM